MTDASCQCNKELRALKVMFSIYVVLTLIGAACLWHRTIASVHAASVADEVTTKRLVIVDDSGKEIAHLGHSNYQNVPSTELLLQTPDGNLGTYRLRVINDVPNHPGLVEVDAQRSPQLPSPMDKRSAYTLMVTDDSAAVTTELNYKDATHLRQHRSVGISTENSDFGQPYRQPFSHLMYCDQQTGECQLVTSVSPHGLKICNANSHQCQVINQQ